MVNPTGQAPAQGAGLQDPHNAQGPPYPPYPSGVYDNYQHPVPSVVAATFPREHCNTIQGALTSGTLYVCQFGGVAGTVITNAAAITATTAKTGGSHGWYVVTDTTLTVLGVTADQTDAATVWGAASTIYPLAFSQPFILPYTGAYYFGICVVASQRPTFGGAASILAGVSAGTGATSPVILSASSGTSLTTPPAAGSVIGALSAVSNFLPYVYFT